MTDQQRMIAELVAREYDEDELNSLGVAQLQELHKKEFPEKYEVADDAVQNQDFTKDPETNANIYKLGPKPFAARREFDKMEAEAAEKRAAEGNTDPTTKMDVDRSGWDKFKDWLRNNAVGRTPASGGSNLPSFGGTLPGQGGAGNSTTTTTVTGGTNNVGSTPNTNTSGGNGGSGSASGDNTPPVDEEDVNAAKKDPRTNYQLKSIYRAYKDGDIDKGTAQYLAMDAIANFARDMAKGQAQLASIYFGGKPGAIEPSETLWDKRNKEMMKQGISSEAATVNGSDKEMERKAQALDLVAKQAGIDSVQLSNELKRIQMAPAEFFSRLAKDPNLTDQQRILFHQMASQATGIDMNLQDYIAGAVAADKTLVTELGNILKNVSGTAGGLLGYLNNIGK